MINNKNILFSKFINKFYNGFVLDNEIEEVNYNILHQPKR